MNRILQEFAVEITVLFLLLIGIGNAHAQDTPIKGPLPLQCLPLMHTDTHIASPLWTHFSSHGACGEWWCIDRKTKLRQMNAYCGTITELPKVGGRVATILKSLDPLKTAQDSPKRFPILPLTDPTFHELRQELK